MAEVSPYESLSATLMHPVPAIVRAGLAESLSLNTRSSVTCFPIADDTMQPCAVHPIKADGNCFFRALCFYLTGSQAQHSILRNAIVNHMTLVCTESIENYLNAKISTYVEETCLWTTTACGPRRPKFWGQLSSSALTSLCFQNVGGVGTQ